MTSRAIFQPEGSAHIEKNLVSAVKAVCEHADATLKNSVTNEQSNTATISFSSQTPKFLCDSLQHLFIHEISASQSATRYIQSITFGDSQVDVTFRNIGTHRYTDADAQWHLISQTEIKKMDSHSRMERLSLVGPDEKLRFFNIDAKGNATADPSIQAHTERAVAHFLNLPVEIPSDEKISSARDEADAKLDHTL